MKQADSANQILTDTFASTFALDFLGKTEIHLFFP